VIRRQKRGNRNPGDVVPLTVIVIAYNEEVNIEQCVASVIDWAEQVFVVDSFSEDRTVELAEAIGGEVIQHEFEDWAAQKNWALESLPVATDWVMFLDADERVTSQFRAEVERLLRGLDVSIDALVVSFDIYFAGRLLRHAADHPYVPRLFRIGAADWKVEGACDYVSLSGEYVKVKSKIVHKDNKLIASWINKQNRNSSIEANWLYEQSTVDYAREEIKVVGAHRLRLWIRRHIYRRFPLLRPIVYFIYRYFFKLGFLDGFAGLAYCFLQGFWYPLLVDLKLRELRRISVKSRT
jgi:glycosyltransferase involved in cell wall biosynthesis